MPDNTPKRILYDGQEWTQHGLARHLGLSSATLQTRIKAGWPKDRWANKPRPGLGKTNLKVPKTVFYQGREWGVFELSRHLGLPNNTIYSRLARGKTLEEAVHLPRSQRVMREELAAIEEPGEEVEPDSEADYFDHVIRPAENEGRFPQQTWFSPIVDGAHA